MSYTGNPTNQETTENGTVYYYNTSAAQTPVMTSAVRLQQALGAFQYAEQDGNIAQIRLNAKSYPQLLAISGTAALGALGAIATFSSAAATAGSAGVGLAGLLGGSQTPETSETAEFTVHNDTGSPLVLYNYNNNNLSTASAVRPLLPGASETMVVSQTGGFEKGTSEINLTFLVGGGVVNVNGQPTVLKPISANVKYSYTNNGNWAPNFHLDGGTTTFEDSNQGLSAAYFMANSDSGALDFTVAAYTVEKASPSLDIVFMPGSAPLA
ncbi:hypothetical protein [Leisingera daeponensis]|uniref:hypothetical protein n=1 Tax=Leisingera daeponensis TaxID=405746 RepID=UPI001C93B5FD|nr:hypothetical protein [Leisingera daeponensis]MBY6056757.1 hypothetical protein [Leisingera daeponensis]